MNKIFLICLFWCITLNSFAQTNYKKDYTLRVNLQNATLKSLAILEYSEPLSVIIRGKNITPFNWEFKIPDSLAENSEYMMLIVPDKDTVRNAYHQIRFFSEEKKQPIVNIGLQDEVNYIKAIYKGQVSYENENIASFLGLKDTVILGNIISDDYNLILKKDSSDITIRSIDPFYSWFFSNKISYSEYLNSYIELAKSYPDSRYLMSYLARNLAQYKNKDDVKSVYKNLSKKHVNTKWGKRIALFLSDEMQNLSFVNLKSKGEESIINDPSKYNLLIFSASWCGPCIEEIPLLKKLHQTLSKNIIFTYVSMDYEKDINAFEKVLIANEIPWRTLYAFKDLNRVSDFFSVKSIPHTILLKPDGSNEVMDLRKEENQKKLLMIK